MSSSNSIKNWSEDDRPREKMLQRGPAALTDAELLTILISSGTKEKSALDLAREVLSLAHNNLQQLGRLSITDFKKIKGIGEARAITIAAAMELGRRRQISEGLQRPAVSGSKHAVEIITPLLRDLNHEAFCVLYLNQANRVLHYELVSNGGLNATVADTRIILKNAIIHSAANLIVAHNHPSGNLRASDHDIVLTRKLKDSAALMDITLLDHIIISGDGFLSMADEGII
jgi:DNA repair protein RadC